MSYIGTYNACRNYNDDHVGHLPENSIAVGSFSVDSNDDLEALEKALKISKKINHKLLSLYHVSGIGPNFDTRKIY